MATRIVLASERESVRHVQARFNQAVERRGYDSEAAAALVIGFEEALSNAFRHGNQRDPSKRITVRYVLEAAWAEVEIADEGEGFDPARVPDPTAETNLQRCGGRGVLMMRALFDEVEYRRGGRQVRLFLRIGPREWKSTRAA